MTANEITKGLLEQLPRRFHCRCWRRNVGVGVGMDTVRKVLALLVSGQVQLAIGLLRQRPVHFGIPGEPDIEGIIGPSGRWFGIEVKSEGDRMATHQKAFGEMIRKHGGIYLVCDRGIDACLEEMELCYRR